MEVTYKEPPLQSLEAALGLCWETNSGSAAPIAGAPNVADSTGYNASTSFNCSPGQ